MLPSPVGRNADEIGKKLFPMPGKQLHGQNPGSPGPKGPAQVSAPAGQQPQGGVHGNIGNISVPGCAQGWLRGTKGMNLTHKWLKSNKKAP